MRKTDLNDLRPYEYLMVPDVNKIYTHVLANSQDSTFSQALFDAIVTAWSVGYLAGNRTKRKLPELREKKRTMETEPVKEKFPEEEPEKPEKRNE